MTPKPTVRRGGSPVERREAPPSQAEISVLHVVAPASVGGLERVLQGLAIGHHKRGHRVRLAALLGTDQRSPGFFDPLRAAGVPIEILQVARLELARERRFIREICRHQAPHVVHTHGYRPDVVDAPVARSEGIPSVTTEHGMSRMGGRTRLYEWLQMRSFRHFDAVVAVSKPIAEQLKAAGVAAERIHTVPNACPDDVEFLGRTAARRALGLEAELVIGWVGRLIRSKGADIFLQAVARLSELPLRAAILGDGPERSRLESLRTELGLDERVCFLGEVARAATYFRAFDLLALSSRTEGTPITLLEAMAAQVPIAAAAVGGVPDMLSEAEARLVPAEAPEPLAAAIRASLSEGRATRDRVIRARERLAKVYGRKAWLDRYEEIYREVRG